MELTNREGDHALGLVPSTPFSAARASYEHYIM